VLYASRARHSGVIAEDLLPVSRTTEPPNIIRRTMHELGSAIGSPVEPPRPRDRLTRLLGTADLDVAARTHTIALELLTNRPSHSGRSPSALAAGALYIASTRTGASARAKWTQAELGDVAGVVRDTVQRAATELVSDHTDNSTDDSHRS
jgi:transcription initiation factor TFIIIB Brf1 subunit/transcription initiation factor TFIIB